MKYTGGQTTDPSQLSKGTTLWSRDTVERALATDDAEELLSAVIAVSMYEEDQKYSEQLCLRLSQHPHFNVRGNAILGFRHIARVHGKLNREYVYPIDVVRWGRRSAAFGVVLRGCHRANAAGTRKS